MQQSSCGYHRQAKRRGASPADNVQMRIHTIKNNYFRLTIIRWERFKMNMGFDAVYYEPDALNYKLGKMLQSKYADLPWVEIENHNRIPELMAADNRDFPKLKSHLIIGVRKTHKYVPNHKVSDWLVPYTSSGCRAMWRSQEQCRM